VGGIDDHATDRKRNSVRGGDPRHDVRFRIDGGRARLGVKPALFQGARDWDINTDNVGVDGARQRFKKPPRPYAIRWKEFLAAPDTSPNNPVAGSEIGRQSTGNSKADDAGSATLDRYCLEGSGELRALLANHRHPLA
jgi:hypothetical protein